MRSWPVIATLIFLARGLAIAAPAREDDTLRAKALLERWLAVQNEGAFTAYEAMYAATFTGVKRVGAKVKKLDRAGWLRDRKSMFRAAMVVAASDVTVTRDGTSVVLEFVQRWEQGTFGDVGRKRMLLDLRDAAAPILAEGLLSSRPVLTETACRRALFPRAARGRVGPAKEDDELVQTQVVELSEAASICRVDHRLDKDSPTTVEVAALASGKRWKVVEKLSFDLAAAEVNDETSAHEDVQLTTFPLTVREQALLLEVKQSKEGPMFQERTSQSQLLRATRTGLQKLLEFSSRSSIGEAGDGRVCEVRSSAKHHRGFPDLILTCTSFTESWHDEDPGDRGRKEEPEATTYQWTGADYEAL
ncbi:MAG: hypothetical protein R3B48_21505 [Kofleriaceae bacterium]